MKTRDRCVDRYKEIDLALFINRLKLYNSVVIHKQSVATVLQLSRFIFKSSSVIGSEQMDSSRVLVKWPLEASGAF